MMYIVFSAICYILSHFFPACAAFCGSAWLVLLYFKYKKNGLTFKEGFFWGLLVFGSHFSWVLATLISLKMNSLLYLLWFFIVFWYALSAGIWFFLTRYSFSLATLCFFVFLTKYSLIFCARLEGYCLLNPLLCYKNIPSFLWIIRLYGDYVGFLLFIILSECAAFVIMHKKFFYTLLLLLIILFDFFIGNFLLKKEDFTINEIVAVKPWWYGCKSGVFAGYRMAECLTYLSDFIEDKKIHAVIFPESTFCFDIDEYDDFFPIWSDGLEDVVIIFGTHRKVQNYYQNCVVILKNKKVERIYDKQHFMPYIEACCFFHVPHALLVNDEIELATKKYQLFVCSELFFEVKPVSQKMILFLWNDSWLFFDWTKHLAGAFIKYFSIKYEVQILHVSTQGKTNISMIGN